ncbi:MAG: hypothetical protein DSO07_04420 [Thermoproteota archaeon]|nr:MAG: hypothetical protein DSO07_04420 [Candidatus Korarchaeota archaeon]
MSGASDSKSLLRRAFPSKTLLPTLSLILTLQATTLTSIHILLPHIPKFLRGMILETNSLRTLTSSSLVIQPPKISPEDEYKL